MQDSNTRRPDEATPDADATSKDTLADLEMNEKDAGSESSGRASQDAHRESEVPSPDGTGDEGRDKRDDAGPI